MEPSAKYPIPHRPKPYKIGQTSRRTKMKQGVTIPIHPHAWITDGPIRKIEEGLPLIVNTTMAAPHENMALLEDQIRAMHADTMKVFFNEELRELSPLLTPRYDDETPVQAPKEEPTGIIEVPPSNDIIDNVGRVNIQSATLRAKRPEDVGPFPRPKDYIPHVTRRAKSTVEVVRSQMQRVFKPGCVPFTNVDTDDDFPLSDIDFRMLTGEEEEEEPVIDYNNEPYETKLLDASVYDVFWTKNKAPFRRQEIDHLYSWRKQKKDYKIALDKRISDKMVAREEAIKRTFQSRRAFDRSMELVAKTCKEVGSILPGKEPRGRESFWVTAARDTRLDVSSLSFRKARWTKFVNFVKAGNDVETPLQRKFCEIFRRELMKGNPITSRTLWPVLDEFEDMNFTERTLLRYIEFVREDLGTTRDSLLAYFDERDIPKYFYELAVQESQQQTMRSPKSKTSPFRSRHSGFGSGRIVIPESPGKGKL